MLTSLTISNYLLIDSLSISFDESLNVITGETGAGKSIIMGALSLIMGGRVDSSVLLDPSKKCFVEATFDLTALSILPFFDSNDLDYDDQTTLRREIAPNGKSRAFVNDTPINLSLLKTLSIKLIDIHSQHSNLLFHDSDFRVHVVDSFAQIGDEMTAYRQRLAAYEQAKADLKQLMDARQERLEKKDYYEFVLQELQQANLRLGEQEELEKEFEFVSHTEKIKATLFQLIQLLSGTDTSLLSQLSQAKSLTDSLAAYRTDLNTIHERVSSLYFELQDVDSEVSSLNDRIDYSPELLQQIKERIDLIYALQQKYHLTTEAALLEKKEELENFFRDFQDDEEQIAHSQRQCNQCYADAMAQAERISQLRRGCIADLQHDIEARIADLGMQNARFEVQMLRLEKMQKNGIDSIQFLFSANPGMPLAEVEKVASGGETSRLMLAVKSVISSKMLLPTIIFDEIDVGISGEVALKVGRAMKSMASVRQLLVITHLPQIAAQSTTHYNVYKRLQDGVSRTSVRLLNDEEKVCEIAQMMSGEQPSDTVLLAAQELINE